MTFRWRIRSGSPESMLIRHEPEAIVRDTIAGTLLREGWQVVLGAQMKLLMRMRLSQEQREHEHAI